MGKPWKFSVDFFFDDLGSLIIELESKYSTVNLALRKASRNLRIYERNMFKSQGAFGSGKRWENLAINTISNRASMGFASTPILRNWGVLAAAAEAAFVRVEDELLLDTNFAQATIDTRNANISSENPEKITKNYAGFHMEGSSIMPARPFLHEVDILKIVGDAVREHLAVQAAKATKKRR